MVENLLSKFVGIAGLLPFFKRRKQHVVYRARNFAFAQRRTAGQFRIRKLD